MSKDETSSPTPRVHISAETFPLPPWTGKYFDCECGARYQLGCADECKEMFLPELEFSEVRQFETPPCWTCGKINVLKIPSEESESEPALSAAERAVEESEGA